MKSSSILMTVLVGSVIVSGAVSCSTSVKISRIQSKGLNSTLTLPSEKELSRYGGEARSQGADSDGLYAMKVSRDEETGESVEKAAEAALYQCKIWWLYPLNFSPFSLRATFPPILSKRLTPRSRSNSLIF